MTSEKQLKANRQNALKGGVKTAEGKAISRMNAITHGLLTRDVLLPGEDGSLLAELRERFMSELQPQGEMETILVERIISSTWRLSRIVRNEAKLSQSTLMDFENKGPVPREDFRYSGWQNFMRYETSLERQVYKAMHELERLQEARIEEKPRPPVSINLDISDDIKRYLSAKDSEQTEICETNPNSDFYGLKSLQQP